LVFLPFRFNNTKGLNIEIPPVAPNNYIYFLKV
jgi:hypothetical protein